MARTPAGPVAGRHIVDHDPGFRRQPADRDIPLRILAFDGALGAFSVARYATDGGFATRTGAAVGSAALEQGLTVIDQVLDGLVLREFDRIAVGTDPGAFTGVRIAFSYAKARALASAIPLWGVSSYDALEPERCPSRSVTETDDELRLRFLQRRFDATA